ncbi:hypothetical protein EOM89_13370 [Candidatus Falkowbacteria bacterium]|nr:hypothetical protein [Candidatus Falkowbacteria bacterium]
MRRLAILPLLIAAATAAAQTVVPAYEGCALAWDYPQNTANHRGFSLSLDGVTGSTQIGKDLRQIPCTDTPLKGKPFGPYTLRLVATASSPATHSPPAVLRIDYQARPTLLAPTNIRTTLEWAPNTTPEAKP